MRTFLLLTLPLALTACSSNPEPQQAPPRPTAPVATPRPAPAPPPQSLSSNWEDRPATPGDWVYRQDDRGSIALFGTQNADALFAIRCDRARRRIYLTHSGKFAEGETGTMTIRATSGLQSYAATNTGGAVSLVGADLSPSDSHLDAMAYSRGKFIVSIKGTSDLVVPSWPEVARVVEDCRGV
jgi:hypothetical protein